MLREWCQIISLSSCSKSAVIWLTQKGGSVVYVWFFYFAIISLPDLSIVIPPWVFFFFEDFRENVKSVTQFRFSFGKTANMKTVFLVALSDENLLHTHDFNTIMRKKFGGSGPNNFLSILIIRTCLKLIIATIIQSITTNFGSWRLGSWIPHLSLNATREGLWFNNIDMQGNA